ncbi:MAG TPA: DUF1707 domain-containing protein [Streptosporangiaceae bacterium]|nr:DUF1707 domain-containing protein [Streptosporangiaceae bacterium]
MPASSSPPRTEGSAPGRRASYANPGMRVSDAERAEVADRLSRHYGDGRLDQAEFNERLDRAMNAKTQSDLHGLFADLPDTDSAQAPLPEWPAPTDPRPPRRARGHGHPRAWRRVPFLIFVILITAIVGRELTRPFIGWLWLGLLALAVLHYGPRLRRRR